MPQTPEPGKKDIAISLTQGNDPYSRESITESYVDEWYKLTWALGAWLKEQGYTVSVSGFSVASNGRNATMTASKR